jgi:hypothetical protein
MIPERTRGRSEWGPKPLWTTQVTSAILQTWDVDVFAAKAAQYGEGWPCSWLRSARASAAAVSAATTRSARARSPSSPSTRRRARTSRPPPRTSSSPPWRPLPPRASGTRRRRLVRTRPRPVPRPLRPARSPRGASVAAMGPSRRRARRCIGDVARGMVGFARATDRRRPPAPLIPRRYYFLSLPAASIFLSSLWPPTRMPSMNTIGKVGKPDQSLMARRSFQREK